MNFKKFISGVSAFAIAASAFAAMTITASAETSTLMEYGTADVAWTADGLATWTAGGSPALADGVVTISGGNGGYATSKTISPTANSIIEVEAVWRAASSTGRAFSAGNGSYFRFGNIIVAQNDQDRKHGYGFTGLDNIGSVTMFAAGSYRVDVTASTWLKINMTIDTSQDKLTSFTIMSEDGATTYASASDVVLSSADYTTVAFGYKKGGSVGTTNTEQLKSIKITETTQEVQTADYTIKHVGPDNVQVKEDQVKSSAVGAQIALSDADKADIAGQYYYVSDDSAEKTVAADGSTVVTVTYRAAEPYTATVTAKNGEDAIKVFSADAVDSSVVNRIYYTKYVAADGKYYVTDANGSYPSYAKNFTAAGNEDVAYTEAEGVLFASEIEDLTPSRSWAANGSVPERYSNGGARRLYGSANVPVWTADQKSKVTVSLWSRNQSSSSVGSLGIYLKDSEGTLAETSVAIIGDWTTGANAEITSAEFVVPAGYTVVLVNESTYNSNLEMDYVVVKGEALPVEMADYTVNYVEGETILKTETLSGVVDEAPVINMADFKLEDAKYACVSNDAGEKTVSADGTLVVNVTCAEIPAVTEATVNYVSGEEIVVSETAAVSGAFEDESYPVPYRRYVAKDGVLYQAARTGNEFRKTVTLGASTVVNIDVTAVNVVEGETFVAVADGDGDPGNNASVRASNASAKRGTLEIADVEPGIYKIVYNMYLRKATGSNGPELFLGEASLGLITTGSNWMSDVAFENIEVTEAGTLSIHDCDMLDTVVLYKTGDVTPQIVTEPIVIGDATGDGKVNATDIQRIGRKVAGKTTGTGNTGQIRTKADGTTVVIGDATGDGKVNATDIQRIGRKVAGKTTGTGNTGQIKTKPNGETIVIGDATGDSKVNATDIQRIGRKVAGKTTGTGNTGQEVEVLAE